VRLLDGRVLVVGGYVDAPFPGEVLRSTEIFNPATGLWSPAAPMSAPRHAAAAITLKDGRVLVAGGTTRFFPPPSVVASAEIYDPATGFWTTVAAMKTPRAVATGTLLADGKVLVVGGGNDLSFGLRSAEIYDPAANVWTETPAMAFLMAESSSRAAAVNLNGHTHCQARRPSPPRSCVRRM
jgi:hypothetical protein